MRILYIADGRSPTARSWIAGMQPYGHEIHLLTSYPCGELPGVASITTLPLAGSEVGRGKAAGPPGQAAKPLAGRLISRFRKGFLGLRYFLGPLTLPGSAQGYLQVLERVRPDLVHSLRIPYEGMLSAFTPAPVKVVVSSWGNDFTLHSGRTFLMRRATRRALERADAFTADCLRDIRLARELGLREQVPAMFAPGSGGLDLERIRGMAASREPNARGVINPRGIRPAYVRNDAFFRSLPAVLAVRPGLPVYCVAMAGEPDALKWVQALSLPENVALLPHMTQAEAWSYGLRARVAVSPATHDGTPNSMLECMALGCLPVVGDIEPLREWIQDGENGLLVDPGDPQAIAAAILRGLEDDALFERARRINARITAERADRRLVIPRIEELYQGLFN